METALNDKVPEVSLADDGIVRVRYKPGTDLTLAVAQATMRDYLTLTGGVRHPLLVDTRDMQSMSREARLFYASEDAARVASAVALLVDTPVSRVLGNFYIGISNPKLPTRLFSDETQALAWLQDFRA